MVLKFFDTVLFHLKASTAFILVFLTCLISFSAFCQQALGAPSNEEIIQQTLADLTPVAGKATTPLPFSRLMTVAIAFEQTHTWKSPSADRLRQLLPDAAGKQSFAALQQLIADGDTAGAVVLQAQMRVGVTPPAELTAGRQLLQQAGFKLAADSLLVTISSEPEEVISALIRIPVEKSPPLEAYLYDRNNPGNNPLNYIKLAQTALGMYAKTPVADKATCGGLLRFLMLFGFGGSQFNIDSVRRIYEKGKGNTDGAIYMLQFLLMRFPDDTSLQADACQLIGSMGCSPQDLVEILGWMSESLKPQYARQVRHDFYAKLAANPKLTDALSLEGLQRDADKLIAAESYLALQQFAMATTTFAEVLNNAREPLPRRLAAWSGLWDTDPDKAIAAIPALTDEILKFPAGAERTALVRWFGGEMGTYAPFIANGWTSKRPKATQPACYTAMATSITRLLTSDSLACLRLENANGPSLRYPAALIYTLAKQGKEANAVLAQTIEYKEFPRPGTRLATTTAKLQQELTVSSPRLNETDEVMKQLVAKMTMFDKSFGKANTTQIDPEPANTTVIIKKCATIKESTDVKSLPTEIRSLAAHFALAVSYLDPKPEGLLVNDPPPAPRNVNLEYLKKITEAIDQAFQNPLVCQNAGIFIQDGLQPAMLSASNPELLEAIFNLSTVIIDKTYATAGKDAAKASITNFANYIEGRQIWDLKPYADKLRARYLAP